jgi:hypothetical protein
LGLIINGKCSAKVTKIGWGRWWEIWEVIAEINRKFVDV